jgi:formylglycine-generating enzyme required for sulfatase activity
MHPRNPSTHLLAILLALVAGFLVSPSPARAQAPASPCAADLTDDGVVDAADLGEVLNAWGPCGKSCSADIDGDGVVAGEDMAVVLNAWGFVCPRITGIGPASGPPFGGNTVTITGTNLGGVTEVWIGGQQANKVVPVDDNTVTAIVPPSQPAGSTGPRTVTLVTDGGESSLADGYTYALLGAGAPPIVGGVAPQSVHVSGGDTIQIVGQNFGGATAVTIDGVAAAFTVVDDGTITATAPAHARGGMFNVAVTTPAGTYTKVGAIAYWQAPGWNPTVLEVEPDPSVVYDPALRVAILKTGRPWRVRYDGHGAGIEMLLIPNGSFNMGCSAASDGSGCDSNETPNHWVTLTKAFYLGRYEVTQAQWMAVTGSNPSHFQPPNTATADANRPVEQISWNDIVNDFQPLTGMRLPTEAEWEWACRAGTTTAYHGWPAQPGGTNEVSLVGAIAWYEANAGSQTRPVGGKAANGFGLHDMAGNVDEWCADFYKANYYEQSPSIDPPGPSSGGLIPIRVLRGGSWYGDASDVRSSNRHSATQVNGSLQGGAGPDLYGWKGFRVARTSS